MHAPGYFLHADVDAFYASVEQLDDSSVKDCPVIVWGADSKDGEPTVASASYSARAFGVRSRMPIDQAASLCPHAAVIAPRQQRYRQVSRQLHLMFCSITPLVESVGLDEAYLDVSDTPDAGRTQATAAALKQEAHRQSGVTLSVGGGTSRIVAKLASDVSKPDGLLLIPPGDEADFMRNLDILLLPGVGESTAGVLRQMGIHTIGELGTYDEKPLADVLGPRASHLIRWASGLDDALFTPHGRRKSLRAEAALHEDQTFHSTVEGLACALAHSLRRLGLVGPVICVTVTPRGSVPSAFQIQLRSPTDDAQIIGRAALELADQYQGPDDDIFMLSIAVTSLRARL